MHTCTYSTSRKSLNKDASRRLIFCVQMHAPRCTHTDEHKRIHNSSATFHVQAVTWLGLESLSPAILVPCWYTVAFEDSEVQLALDMQTQMHTDVHRQTEMNARQTTSSVWSDATSRRVQTLDVRSRTFRMHYTCYLITSTPSHNASPPPHTFHTHTHVHILLRRGQMMF